ncbi:MAG: GntR family transcriptional regulator [Desulfobacterales bacterium]|nr:GntR family transcriptional regulator [Desulfobacterales bacterium]
MKETAKIFSQQNRPTMTQIALENIREAIEKGWLKPGERVVESRLSKELGMSRFPIREALCYLEKEGLVETIPFKGVRVARITPQDIEDLMTVRCALEELAVKRAIRRMTPEKINRLKEIMEQMEGALAEGNKEDILNADLYFHQSICEFAENSRLLNAWLPLASQIRVCLRMEYPLFPTSEEFVNTHVPLLEAVEAGDEKTAVKLVQDHICGATNRIIPGHRQEKDDS